MARGFSESMVEQAALAWLESLGWSIEHGADVAPGDVGAERRDYVEAVLPVRVRDALGRLNPALPQSALEDAFRRLTRPEGATLVERNRHFHRMLVDGVTVEYTIAAGVIRGAQVRMVDFDNPERNDWCAINQFTVKGPMRLRRPDVLLFLNGLPVAELELKDPGDETATIWTAYDQLQTYKSEYGIPNLMEYNEICVISDGVETRIGSLTASKEWFMHWRPMATEEEAFAGRTQLEEVLRGVFEHKRFLDLLRSFIVFEEDNGVVRKKIAGYHQFHATRAAVTQILAASRETGDRRGGVVWHTQGSGKSLTMVFLAGKLAQQVQLTNPTVVILTDRLDLDGQLFAVFSQCVDLLRQQPVQAESRTDLRELLRREAGGIVFTTIQKFLPDDDDDAPGYLSDRRNVVVIADEAHRSQYDFIDGYAWHMREALPNATFVGFTGTPLELSDRDTRAVFGDYVSIYDVQRAVDDHAIVPIYYESRLVELDLRPEYKPLLDEEFAEITEGEDEPRLARLKTKWAALESVVGTERRLSLIAQDLVSHYEARCTAITGKAMVVCMSRRICVDLYEEIVKLRPEWDDASDSEGALKVVMTGSATDPVAWQAHIRNKDRREDLARRFRSPDDPFRMVLVRDMWLTGFDVPSLHTMYLDKPMQGHGLMQTIARVNRVFRDKPGGLVVDYLGLAENLKQALVTYSASGGRGSAARDVNEAIALMLEKYEICRDLFHGFDYSSFISQTATIRLSLLPAAMDFILRKENGKERLVSNVLALSRAFALAVPADEALAIRDHVAFFQSVKAQLVKSTGATLRVGDDREFAIRQVIAGALTPMGVLDVFATAGLDRPDVAMLSDEFLAEVRDMPQHSLAAAMLEKLLRDDVRVRLSANLVQSRTFSDLLETSVRRYQARAITTAQLIEELIALAKELREVSGRADRLGLLEDELAFYDALILNESAMGGLGDAALREIARELVATVRANITVDWTIRENIRAHLRVVVKRLLRKHGYPPDRQEGATHTILEQAELFSKEWTGVA